MIIFEHAWGSFFLDLLLLLFYVGYHITLNHFIISSLAASLNWVQDFLFDCGKR